MRHRCGHPGYRDRLQPFQATQLGVRLAQPIEHRRAYECFGIETAAGRSQGAPDRIAQPQVDPQRIERKHIAESECSLEGHRRQRSFRSRCGGDRPRSALHAANQRIQGRGLQLISRPGIAITRSRGAPASLR